MYSRMYVVSQFSHSVVSDSLQSHGLQHARFPVHHQLPELARTHVHQVGDAIQPSRALSFPFLLPSIFPSIGDFSNESVLCIRWSNYWSFIFSISPSIEYSGLLSFRIDWLDLHAVQGTLKSLSQHHCLKASILRCSAFFMVQLSHPYITAGKTIALTRRTFVSKVMSLLLIQRNINNLRYADDTTLMAESKEELKNLLMKVREESEKAGLKLNIQTKIMASGHITLWQIDEETMETVTDFIFLGPKITADGNYSHEIKRHLLLGRKAMTNLDRVLKSRDITLPAKVHLVKAMVFLVVMCGCESWTES